ncbi:MAG: hypothetical protein CMN76_12940 [Spirochaetaceae bacterium]|nr:hypothetical protein [Spirochaetaceae bacterium]|tara:strand:- start:5044 stop:5463 length:420 start_codon:yes stop_codon:yes gene_type:complete
MPGFSLPILQNPTNFSVTIALNRTFRGMSDLETRMGILEHRMDNNEEQNRRLEDELVRSRIEVRDALQRLAARTNETNQRIDQLSSQLTGQTLELSREILNMSGELRRTNRWIVTVAATMTTAITVLLPITFKLADRYL